MTFIMGSISFSEGIMFYFKKQKEKIGKAKSPQNLTQ